MTNYHFIHGKVLKGKERQEFIDSVGISYAKFKREFWGERIVPLNREYVVGVTRGRYRNENGHVTINISDALIKACQRRTRYWERALEEIEGEPTPYAERHPHAVIR